MRNLISIFLVVTGVAALGLYMGWFDISLESGFDKSKATITAHKKTSKSKNKADSPPQVVQNEGTLAADDSKRPAMQSDARP